MNFSTRKKRRGLFNPNLDVRSVLESECYSVVFVYRCSFQKCKPLPFVPGFKDEGLFFYCADEDAKFSVSLHPAVTLCGCCVQPIHRRFITLDQTVALPGALVLGLLLGNILLDALADRFCNYLQFFVQGFDFCIEFGAISHHLAHCFTGFEVLLTGAHQLIKGFEEGLLNDLCIKGQCLALGFTIELAIASPNLSAVSFMPESRKGLWNKDFCKKKKNESCNTNGIITFVLIWQGQKDLNPRHAVLETAALPTELYPYICEAPKIGASWWATRDSNPGPFGYEPSALTN